MDEEIAIIESILREEAEFSGEDLGSGWKTVKAKSSRRIPRAVVTPEFVRANGASVVTVDASSGVFRSLEEEAEDRRRRVVEAQRTALEIAAGNGVGTSRKTEVDYEEAAKGDFTVTAAESFGDRKGKREKKTPQLTVSEAAQRIDADHLAAFLIDTSSNFELVVDIQLTRFADYFDNAFASVSSAEFPWQKLLTESSVIEMIDIPLAHLPEVVYKVSADWLKQRSQNAIGSFILWLWDSFLDHDSNYQGNIDAGKKVVQEKPLKSMVSIFCLLAIALRINPDALISLLPVLKGNPKYFQQDMFPFNIWLVSQVLEGDTCVGLYMWVNFLLPMLDSISTPCTRDWVLQLGERILSSLKFRKIKLNGTVRKGERLVPPSSLEVLMRLAFPSSENRIKATQRFEAIYPTLKSISLAGFQSKKQMKQVSEQLLSIAIHSAAVSSRSEEATDLALWCLSVNPACYEQWDDLYMDNIEASLAILRKLNFKWKEESAKLPPESLRKMLLHFRKKNQIVLSSKEYKLELSCVKEAEKQCGILLNHLSPGHHWLKIAMIISVLLALCSISLAAVPMFSRKALSY